MKNTTYLILFALLLSVNACQKQELQVEYPSLEELLYKDKAFSALELEVNTAVQKIPVEERGNLAQFMFENKAELEKLYQPEAQKVESSLNLKSNTLALGESTTFAVYANDYWTNSIEVQQGEIYTFSAEGTWTDLVFTTDADGYTNWYISLFDGLKRMQGEDWFKLIGAIDKNNLFPIGKSNTLTMSQSGQLNLFANDANGFYLNNFGHIHLTVTRIQ